MEHKSPDTIESLRAQVAVLQHGRDVWKQSAIDEQAIVKKLSAEVAGLRQDNDRLGRGWSALHSQVANLEATLKRHEGCRLRDIAENARLRAALEQLHKWLKAHGSHAHGIAIIDAALSATPAAPDAWQPIETAAFARGVEAAARLVENTIGSRHALAEAIRNNLIPAPPREAQKL